MSTRLSVIIPALNEAAALPGLLDALGAQTRPPDEIVVADAGSTDGTVAEALARGARVVPGGRPGPGRNAGARAATGDVFLFLDADVLPAREFVAGVLDEFERESLDVATCLMEPLGGALHDRVITEAANVYLQIIEPFSPHAPGFCIVVKRRLHELIGGFDETVKMNEDHDYVQRAAVHGQFDLLTGVRIAVSMRRIEKEGLTRLAVKYLWCEMHALAGQPVYNMPFQYEFGAFPARPTDHGQWRSLIDIVQLREQLGRFDNPLLDLSERGRARLHELAHLEWLSAARGRMRLMLEPPDLAVLSRYLQQRQALLRLARRPLRERLARLQNLQGDALRESIRFLDWERLRKRD
jgi:hypothetical protein